MRTETTTRMLYKFDELSDDGKKKVIEKLWDLNVDYEWWEFIYEDAEQVGLEITEFDLDRGAYVKGKFTQAAIDVANEIIKEHGKDCETYKTAMEYIEEYAYMENHYRDMAIKEDDDAYWDVEDMYTDDIDIDFRQALLEDYASILQKEYNYQTSREAIIETIEANDYEFTADGNLA